MKIEARFTLAPGDIVAGHRMHYRVSDDVWKLYVVGILAITAIFAVIGYLMNFPFLAAIGFFIGIAAFGTPILLEIHIRQTAKKMLPEDVHYTLSEEGVEFAGRVARSKLAWEVFTKASIDDRGLLLYTADLAYTFIPARAFAGEYPKEALKTMMLSQLKKNCPTRRQSQRDGYVLSV